MNSALLLEALNGAAITPEFLCLALLVNYLVMEARRRELSWYDWFHLPPSMDLMLAVFICDSGLFVRSTITWAWRFLGAGDFNTAQAAGLIAGGAISALGFLCKIRALTRPDYGNRPWIVSTGVSVVMALLFTALLAL